MSEKMSACDQILFKKQLTLFPVECVYDLIGKSIDGCEYLRSLHFQFSNNGGRNIKMND